ncbi:MAG: hypothetical protein LBE09_08430, partial [Christensenellaceae bacterium]|nr:hypothetical protein [Christensenellaceae bacterium]
TIVIKNNIASMELLIPVIKFGDGANFDEVVVLQFTGEAFSQYIIEQYISVKNADAESLIPDPKGTFEINFLSNTAGASQLPITSPLTAGGYRVIIKFTPVDSPLYNSSEQTISDMFTVSRGEPSLSMSDTIAEYSGSPVTGSEVKVSGFNNFEIGESTVKKYYRITNTNDEWSDQAFSNVGQYDVKIVFSGDNGNYAATEKTYERYITITKAKFLLTVNLEGVPEKAYNGKYVVSNDIGFSGFPNDPTGTTGQFSYQYRLNGNTGPTGIDIAPQDAGTYDVRVIYTSGEADNYADDSRWYLSMIIITQVDVPTIEFDKISATYTGANIATFKMPTAKGIDNYPVDSKGTTVLFSKVQPSGGYDWTPDLPIAAGTYHVKVEFIPDSQNYKTTSRTFDNYCTITKFKTIVSFEKLSVEYGTEITIQMLKDATTYTKALYDTYNSELPTYTFTIPGATLSDNGVFNITNSGSYSVTVKVEFESENTNYTGSSILNGSLVILNITPELVFKNGITSVVYDYTGVKHDSNEVIAKVKEGSAPKGQIVYSYRLTGTSDSSWTDAAPVNTGIYDVKATYVKGLSNDNYSDGSQIFKQSIEIRACAVYIKVLPNQNVDYTGNPVNYTVKYMAVDSEGNSKTLPLNTIVNGTLQIGNGDVIYAGTYGVSLGTLSYMSAGTNDTSNYNVALYNEGIAPTVVINKRVVKLLFASIDLVYNGEEKTVAVTIDKNTVAQNDTIAPVVSHSGDRLNVSGKGFTVEVTGLTGYASNNYTFDTATAFRNYFIIPATITDVEYNNVRENYNGKEYTLKITQGDNAGVDVKYSASTTYVLPGKYTITALVTKANYADLTLVATLEILRSELLILPQDIIVDNVSELYFGDPLPRLTDRNGLGTLSFTELNNSLAVGQKTYQLAYRPNDIYYLTSYVNIPLTVQKGRITISVPNLDSYNSVEKIKAFIMTVGNTLLSNDYRNAASITYISSDGVETATEPTKPGNYIVIIKYAGDDNYLATEVRLEFTIPNNKYDYTIWIVEGVVAVIVIAGIIFSVVRKKRISLPKDQNPE